jgi:hypothetical protein
MGALLSLYFGVRYSLRAIKMHNDISPFNGKNNPPEDSYQDSVG